MEILIVISDLVVFSKKGHKLFEILCCPVSLSTHLFRLDEIDSRILMLAPGHEAGKYAE